MDDFNKRVAAYIDGSNLYHKLKEIKIENTLDFNYRGFADSLARGRKVVSYRYYVGVVRAKFGDEKANQMRAGQQKLFSSLGRAEIKIAGEAHELAASVNQIGEQAAAKYGLNFLTQDFKKHDGFKKACALSRQLGLYLQNYCGCEFSRH